MSLKPLPDAHPTSTEARKSGLGRGRAAPGGPATMSPLCQGGAVEAAACIMHWSGHDAGPPAFIEIISSDALRIAPECLTEAPQRPWNVEKAERAVQSAGKGPEIVVLGEALRSGSLTLPTSVPGSSRSSPSWSTTPPSTASAMTAPMTPPGSSCETTSGSRDFTLTPPEPAEGSLPPFDKLRTRESFAIVSPCQRENLRRPESG